jgi:hypothetical protein
MKSDDILSESAGNIMIINNSTDLNYDNNFVNENDKIDIIIRSDSMKYIEIQI